MTPLDLLTHRSGLPRHDLVWYGAKESRKELFERLRHLEPNRPFRAHWQYQNLMFMTAGYLVGNVSGGTWEQFTRRRILDPLQMSRSNFSVAASARDADHALPYVKKEEKVEAVPFRSLDTIGPAGSINSSAADMARWVLLQLGRGAVEGKRVASSATIAATHRPRMVLPGPLRDPAFGYTTYALGWMVVTYRGHLMIHHGGNIDGFSALVAFLPRDNVGLVVLTNLGANPLPGLLRNVLVDRCLALERIDWADRTRKRIANRKKAAEESKEKREPKPGTKPSLALKAYAGKYTHPGYGTLTDARLYDPTFLTTLAGKYRIAKQVTTVELRGGKKLFVVVPGQPAYECEPRAGTRFGLKSLKGHSVVFKLGDDGKPTALVFHQPNGVFTAKRAP